MSIKWNGLTQGKPWVRFITGLLLLAGVLGLLSGQMVVWGAKYSGQLAGSSAFQSGTLQLSDTIGGTKCLSSPNAASAITTNQATCSSTYPLSKTIATSVTTTLGNQGSITPTAATVATGGTCGVQEIADTSTAGTDTGLPIGGVTYGSAGPTTLTGVSSITTDGTTGWGETLTGAASPTNYTLMAWVKPAALNGVIMGASDTQTDVAATNADRMIWIDTAGRVDFANDTQVVRATAGSALTTGNWYLVVATKSTTAGMSLYISSGTANNTSATAAAKATLAYTGWNHLGWGDAVGSGFANSPTTDFFSGALADEAVFPTALTGAQVTTLFGETSQSALSTQVLADAPTSYWPMQDTGTSLYTGSIANLTANANPTSYRDASGNPGTNTGTGEGTLGVDASGPIGDTATTFDGSTGWIETAVGNTGTFLATPGPQTFSIAAWFKTSTKNGSIIGFTTLQTNGTPTMWDRHIWIDANGYLVFGVYPNGYFTISSSATTTKNYADGNWHHVVVTVAPVSATVGTVLMYADGALVAGSVGNETITNSQPAQVYGGWWHLGWSNASSTWPDAPTDPYWTGSLGQVAVFPTVLSSANVTSLYSAGSASSYLTAVTGGVAASNAFWPLDEQAAPASPPCTYIAVTVQAGSTCIYPIEAGACPAVPASNWLSMSASVPTSLPALSMTTAVSGTVPTTGVGLHVSVPWVISDSSGAFSAQLTHNLGYVLL